MTKQEFLDKKTHVKGEWATLQLMLGMSKTQLLTALRHIKMMKKCLYTTESRQLTFDEVLNSCEQAWTYLEHEQDKPKN